MREILIIVGGLLLALGFRLSRGRPAKKMGAFLFVLTMGYGGYLLAGCEGALLGALIWFFLPLLEIFGKHRKEQFPFQYQYAGKNKPEMTFFPHAIQALASLDELSFDFVERRHWSWLGMHKHHHIFWQPELEMSASVCLCERENVVFSYLTICSELLDGRILRTTNFPFSSRLRIPPHIAWNHVPCEESRFEKLLESHQKFVAKLHRKDSPPKLPDPDVLGKQWESELQSQLDYNLETGIIAMSCSNTYKYTTKGLIYLWLQSVKDIVRLC